MTASSSPRDSGVAARVRELIAPTVERLGVTLWDVEFAKEGAQWHLRVTIDSAARDGAVSIDDCERVHREIEPLIDEEDPIEAFYYLDVSSPGVERVLRTDEHFSWAVQRGERLRLRLFAPLPGEGEREILARVISFDGETLALSREDGSTLTLPRTAVSRALVYYDFGADFAQGEP